MATSGRRGTFFAYVETASRRRSVSEVTLMCRTMITLCTLVMLAAGTARASDRDPSQDRPASAVETSPADAEGTTAPVPPGASRTALTTLYASFIALQAY